MAFINQAVTVLQTLVIALGAGLAVCRLVAPILAFTSDEIWQSMPHASDCDARHVVYNEMPKPT